MVKTSQIKKGSEVFVCTDNMVMKRRCTKDLSKSTKLHDLIVELRKLEVEYKLIIHFFRLPVPEWLLKEPTSFLGLQFQQVVWRSKSSYNLYCWTKRLLNYKVIWGVKWKSDWWTTTRILQTQRIGFTKYSQSPRAAGFGVFPVPGEDCCRTIVQGKTHTPWVMRCLHLSNADGTIIGPHAF